MCMCMFVCMYVCVLPTRELGSERGAMDGLALVLDVHVVLPWTQCHVLVPGCDGWMGGWVNGWMDGWVGEWMDG